MVKLVRLFPLPVVIIRFSFNLYTWQLSSKTQNGEASWRPCIILFPNCDCWWWILSAKLKQSVLLFLDNWFSIVSDSDSLWAGQSRGWNSVEARCSLSVQASLKAHLDSCMMSSGFSPKQKWPWCDHPPLFSAEVVNGLEYTSAFSVWLHRCAMLWPYLYLLLFLLGPS